MDVLGAIATVFVRSGFEVYLVGGSVRDRLLGRRSKDLDMTTPARPDDIKRLLRQAEPDSVYEVGARFGTIGAVFGDLNVEVTTYRAEWYPEESSRHPEVEFGNSLQDDLARRDFTINAIAQDIGTGKITDPHGGTADIAKRTIRAVGNPADRFAEDPLRMLRGVRLATQLGFDIDPKTAAAIKGGATRLQFISAADLASTQQDDRHQHKDVLAHTLRVLAGVPEDPQVRLAALLHDIGKPATMTAKGGRVHFYRHEIVGARLARKILDRLNFDKATVRTVADLVALHMRSNLYESDWTDGAVRRYMREVGELRPWLLALSRADITSYHPKRIANGLKRVAELAARCDLLAGQADVARMDSPLDGTRLMELFAREPGPWIKPIKDYLLGLVLDGELDQADTATATRLAREFVADGGGAEADEPATDEEVPPAEG